MTFKDKMALVIDHSGENEAHAACLADSFGVVNYYTTWESDYSFRSKAIGMGYQDNLIKIDDYWHYVDDADLICFLDLGGEGAAHYLKTHKDPKGNEYPLYGAGLGERLERDRHASRVIQQTLGLPTQNFEKVVGVSKLREALKGKEPKYVKSDTTTRADLETWKSFSPEAAEIFVDAIESASGPYKQKREFLVEEKLEGIVEPGPDLYFNGKSFLRPCMWGIEIGVPYIGKIDSTLPDFMEEIMAKMTPILQELDYRGAISFEMIVTEKDKAFLIDWTTRLATPLGIIHTKAIKNYSPVIWACAHKEDIEVEYDTKYVMGCNLKCDFARHNWLPVQVPKKYEDKVTFFNACKKGDLHYIIPEYQGQIYVVVLGDNLEKMYEEVEEIAESIEGHEVDASPLYHLRKALKGVDKLRDLGISF